jgi:glyoxylase-like metal-dependent hydrolase (beta-lactamase superfamily II)
MRATTVTDNLIQLTKLRFVNAYLVREPDGFTLVDTTMGKSADALIAAAREAGAPIRRIALTHGHTDHAGAVDDLRAKLGAEVQVLVPELDARILAGEKVVEGKLTGSWPKLTTVPDVSLEPGDRVGSLEVVPSPGHTPGHVSFLDTRDRSLIAGDVFATIGGPAVSNHLYWRFPLPGFATFDKPQDLASAKVLRTLDPTVLVVGHGQAIRNPGAAMDRAIQQAGG